MKNKIINKLQALRYAVIQMNKSDYGFDEWKRISYQNAPNFDFFNLENPNEEFIEEGILEFSNQINETCVDKLLKAVFGSGGLARTSRIFMLELLDIETIKEMDLLKNLDLEKEEHIFMKAIEEQTLALTTIKALQTQMSHSTSKTEK